MNCERIQEIAKRVGKEERKWREGIGDASEAILDEYETRSKTQAADYLAHLATALETGNYYTRVDTVARSGLSRTIRIATIMDGVIREAPMYVYKLAGCNNKKRIEGCGMDMLFAAQYSLWCATHKDSEPYQRMPRYKELP